MLLGHDQYLEENKVGIWTKGWRGRTFTDGVARKEFFDSRLSEQNLNTVEASQHKSLAKVFDRENVKCKGSRVLFAKRVEGAVGTGKPKKESRRNLIR